MTSPNLLSAAELAPLLEVDETTIRRRHKAGEIPGHSFGKNGVVFMRDELVAAGILPADADDAPALAEDDEEAGA